MYNPFKRPPTPEEQEEKYRDQEFLEGENKYDIPPETNIELQTGLINPDSKKVWDHLNKDDVISNLQEWELRLVRLYNDLISSCAYVNAQKAGAFFMSMKAGVLTSSQSRYGFNRRLLATVISQQQRSISREKKGGLR